MQYTGPPILGNSIPAKAFWDGAAALGLSLTGMKLDLKTHLVLPDGPQDLVNPCYQVRLLTEHRASVFRFLDRSEYA